MVPRAFLKQLMSSDEESSSKSGGMTAQDSFKDYLRLMDKYRDYFSGPWPKKWDFKYATTFTQEDEEFIDEGEDDFVDRFLTVILKKNVSLEGFNALGFQWTYDAYREQFVKPDLKKTYEAFKALVKTGAGAEEILKKMLENQNVSFVHMSLVELLEDEPYLWDNKPLDQKVSEVLELIHTKEGYPECSEDEEYPEGNQCKRQREKLKKNLRKRSRCS